jgi:hypothetical protein
MIKTELLSANALTLVPPAKLKTEDFDQIAPPIDSLIRQHVKIRLLIDASGFNGWENIAAFENHAGFVKFQNVVDGAAATAERSRAPSHADR